MPGQQVPELRAKTGQHRVRPQRIIPEVVVRPVLGVQKSNVPNKRRAGGGSAIQQEEAEPVLPPPRDVRKPGTDSTNCTTARKMLQAVFTVLAKDTWSAQLQTSFGAPAVKPSADQSPAARSWESRRRL